MKKILRNFRGVIRYVSASYSSSPQKVFISLNGFGFGDCLDTVNFVHSCLFLKKILLSYCPDMTLRGEEVDMFHDLIHLHIVKYPWGQDRIGF